MSVQLPTDETVSDVQHDVVLERRSWNYGYLGRDTDGREHHVDHKTNRVIVTETTFERDDTGPVPVYRVRGPILHAEDLDQYGASKDLTEWVQFIDEECGGWDERPKDICAIVQDELAEGL